jgi:RNA polymerase sigma-70 factor (ECF subfamily)
LRALALAEARWILDPDAAQDAAQEAIVRAWRHAHSQSGADHEAWVRTIARREALRIAGRRSYETLPEGYEATSDLDEPEAADRRLDVAVALSYLTQEEQWALLLRYWAGKTDQEIADQIDAPIGTVKIRIYRAKAKLATAGVCAATWG